MAKSRKAAVLDELHTLFTSPSAYSEQAKLCTAGPGEQLLSKVASISLQLAQQHFECAAHLANPTVFGRKAPKVTQQHVTESLLHSLLASSSEKTPGFSQLLKLGAAKGSSAGGQPAPLLRLLRRVCLWYYYRVMFDPLDQLLALTSGCELLFQLMTPNQQLSCMADILLVLACPSMEEHCGDLDTPLHTATLLSMLKMAQQLALAEADLQESNALGMQQDEQQQRELDQQQQRWAQEAAAVDACVPAGLALLRLAKESELQLDAAAASPAHTLFRQEARQVLVQACPGMIRERIKQHEGRWNMLGLDSATASLQHSKACKAVGALLSQLSQLPNQQLQHWWKSADHFEAAWTQQDAEHAEVLILWLLDCFKGLIDSGEVVGLVSQAGADPVMQLLQLLTALISTPSQQQGTSTQQQQQQQQEVQEPDPQQQEQGAGAHPAEALRQLLDVLLSALQYRHVLSMQQWCLPEGRLLGQQQLLTALHCHCVQLLAQARDGLPPAACALAKQQPRTSSSSDSSSDSSSGSSQQEAEAWQLCLVQVQHNVLLVLQLIQHWQYHNAHLCLGHAIEKHSASSPVFLPHFIQPPGTQQASGAAAAAAAAAMRQHARDLQQEARAAVAGGGGGSLAQHEARAQYADITERAGLLQLRELDMLVGQCAAAAAAGADAPPASPGSVGQDSPDLELQGPAAAAAEQLQELGMQLLSDDASHHMSCDADALLRLQRTCSVDSPKELLAVVALAVNLLLMALCSSENATAQVFRSEGVALPCRGQQLQALLQALDPPVDDLLIAEVLREWEWVVQQVQQLEAVLQAQQQQQQQDEEEEDGLTIASTAAGVEAASAGLSAADECGSPGSAAAVLRIKGGAGGSSSGSAGSSEAGDDEAGSGTGSMQKQQKQQQWKRQGAAAAAAAAGSSAVAEPGTSHVSFKGQQLLQAAQQMRLPMTDPSVSPADLGASLEQLMLSAAGGEQQPAVGTVRPAAAAAAEAAAAGGTFIGPLEAAATQTGPASRRPGYTSFTPPTAAAAEGVTTEDVDFDMLKSSAEGGRSGWVSAAARRATTAAAAAASAAAEDDLSVDSSGSGNGSEGGWAAQSGVTAAAGPPPAAAQRADVSGVRHDQQQQCQQQAGSSSGGTADRGAPLQQQEGSDVSDLGVYLLSDAELGGEATTAEFKESMLLLIQDVHNGTLFAQQQQQHQKRQRQQPASLMVVQVFTPTGTGRDHFQLMEQQQAAAWVDLLCTMAAADKAVTAACRRLLVEAGALPLPITRAASDDAAVGSSEAVHTSVVQTLQTDICVLALMVYCLMHDPGQAFTRPGDRVAAARVFRQLLQALDFAYRAVQDRSLSVFGLVREAATVADVRLYVPLERLRRLGLAVQLPPRQQGHRVEASTTRTTHT